VCFFFVFVFCTVLFVSLSVCLYFLFVSVSCVGSNIYIIYTLVRICSLKDIYALHSRPTFSHSRSLKYTHTHTLIHTHTPSLSSLSLSLPHYSHSLSLSLSTCTRTHTHTIPHSPQTYPSDSISDALENVFSFDAYDPFLKDHVIESLAKVGFRIDREHFLPSLAARQKVVESRKNKLSMSYERSASTDKARGPKHGKIDDTNEPHVGGNTWAGGTGGRDTAGMGGKGGPYRLDVGNPIHQVRVRGESARVRREEVSCQKKSALVCVCVCV
jgi:hypothetical protein